MSWFAWRTFQPKFEAKTFCSWSPRDAPIWGKGLVRCCFSFFLISSKSRFHNPIIILPYIHTFSFLFCISFVSSHMDSSVLLGLLYLDVYRHGRDPLTHHASTSNINLEEQGVTNEAANPKSKSHRGPLAVWNPQSTQSQTYSNPERNICLFLHATSTQTRAHTNYSWIKS